MAGISLGACSPASSSPAPQAAPKRPTLRLAASSRTRRNHGVFMVGDQLATVCSTRRAGDAHGVLLQFGAGHLVLNGTMTPAQAQQMARALTAAAAAADQAQQRERDQAEPTKPASDEANSTDARIGMAWWDNLTEAERLHWLRAACSAMPADAWRCFKEGDQRQQEGGAA